MTRKYIFDPIMLRPVPIGYYTERVREVPMTDPITTCRTCHTHWSDCDVLDDGQCAGCLRKDEERLLAAIYAEGESPMEQRVQIDPVDYLRTRYVSVGVHHEAIDFLNRTHSKRAETMRRLLVTACDAWERNEQLTISVQKAWDGTVMVPNRMTINLPRSWYDEARKAIEAKGGNDDANSKMP